MDSEKGLHSNYDLTQTGSDKGDKIATGFAKVNEPAEGNETLNPGEISAKEGDDQTENEIATSLDDE